MAESQVDTTRRQRGPEAVVSGGQGSAAEAERLPRLDVEWADEAPARIGNCRVEGEIGSGGMAVVYRAVQEPLGRVVAVKALKRELIEAAGNVADVREGEFGIRFEREARALAALQHENVIQIHDYAVQGDRAFIVMEYVEGIDLFDLLERARRLPPDVAALVALSLARALDHAHFHGILHRDIKPANVMVASNGAVKLMDFGIARDRSGVDLTGDGMGLGTPSYMSPEQVLGERLDFRSDMFAVGIVLYQMVCGRKPFVEDRERTVLQKIRLERPVAPRRLNAKLPRELERIIVRCLEKKKEYRYHSMQDLVYALERFLAPRCGMNHRARMVMFLRDQGVIGEEEAGRYLHPSAAGGYGASLGPARVAGPVEAAARRAWRWMLGPRGTRRLVWTEVAAVLGMALLVGLVHALPSHGSGGGEAAGREAAKVADAAAARRGVGFLKVATEPATQIFVDGKLVDRAPLDKPLELGEGKHRIELRHAHLGTERRVVRVEAGTTRTLRVAFRR